MLAKYKPRPRVFRRDISLMQLVFEETGDVFDANYTYIHVHERVYVI